MSSFHSILLNALQHLPLLLHICLSLSMCHILQHDSFYSIQLNIKKDKKENSSLIWMGYIRLNIFSNLVLIKGKKNQTWDVNTILWKYKYLRRNWISYPNVPKQNLWIPGFGRLIAKLTFHESRSSQEEIWLGMWGFLTLSQFCILEWPHLQVWKSQKNFEKGLFNSQPICSTSYGNHWFASIADENKWHPWW